MKKARLQIEKLEDRNTPSCTASSFYGDWATSNDPSYIGLQENSYLAHFYQDIGDPAAWGANNQQFGQSHGCD